MSVEEHTNVPKGWAFLGLFKSVWQWPEGLSLEMWDIPALQWKHGKVLDKGWEPSKGC